MLGIFIISNTNAQTDAKIEVSLNSGWNFRQVNKSEWKTAPVSGCVHTDLLANKLIEDPYYRDNEKNLQWIGKIYGRIFADNYFDLIPGKTMEIEYKSTNKMSADEFINKLKIRSLYDAFNQI